MSITSYIIYLYRILSRVIYKLYISYMTYKSHMSDATYQSHLLDESNSISVTYESYLAKSN